MSGIKTSARNLFAGRVAKISRGAVNAEVILDIDGQELVAVITNESVENLALKEGGRAYGLIKASWVILTDDSGDLKTSARNHLKGTVEKIETGAVNSEVALALSGGRRLVAIITNESVKNLGLQAGAPAGALIKASHVIIAVDARS